MKFNHRVDSGSSKCTQKLHDAHYIVKLQCLYYYMKNFCNLIGLEQWYFSLVWNTYMWKLQNFAVSVV